MFISSFGPKFLKSIVLLLHMRGKKVVKWWW